MAGLEQFHQCKSHDETDGRPFEASQSGLKHPAQTLAQATIRLKRALDLGGVHTQLTHPISWGHTSRTRALKAALRCRRGRRSFWRRRRLLGPSGLLLSRRFLMGPRRRRRRRLGSCRSRSRSRSSSLLCAGNDKRCADQNSDER